MHTRNVSKSILHKSFEVKVMAEAVRNPGAGGGAAPAADASEDPAPLEKLDPFLLQKIVDALPIHSVPAVREVSNALAVGIRPSQTIEFDYRGHKPWMLGGGTVENKLGAVPNVEVWNKPLNTSGLQALAEKPGRLRYVKLDGSELRSPPSPAQSEDPRDNKGWLRRNPNIVRFLRHLFQHNPGIDVLRMEKVTLRCDQRALIKMCHWFYFATEQMQYVKRLFFDFEVTVLERYDAPGLTGVYNFNWAVINNVAKHCRSLTHFCWKRLFFRHTLRYDGHDVPEPYAAEIKEYTKSCGKLAENNPGLVYVDFSDAEFGHTTIGEPEECDADVTGGQCLVQGVLAMALTLDLQHINLNKTALAMTSADLRALARSCPNLVYLNIGHEEGWFHPYRSITPRPMLTRQDIDFVLKTCKKLKVFCVRARLDVHYMDSIIDHYLEHGTHSPQRPPGWVDRATRRAREKGPEHR